MFDSKRLRDQVEYLKAENELLKHNVSELSRVNAQLKEDQTNPRKIVEKIMQQEINWYDYKEMDLPEQSAYWREAQMILNTKVFQNEKNKLIALWSKWSLQQSHSFEEVRDMRHQVSGIQLLTEQIEEIANPVQKHTMDSLDEAV